MVRPIEPAIFAFRGISGPSAPDYLSHRPVKPVSHAPRHNVSYHSPACVNKGPGAFKNKDYSEK